jgi:hypothetical protein
VAAPGELSGLQVERGAQAVLDGRTHAPGARSELEIAVACTSGVRGRYSIARGESHRADPRAREPAWRHRAAVEVRDYFREPPRSKRPEMPANPVKLTFLSLSSVRSSVIGESWLRKVDRLPPITGAIATSFESR